MPQPNRNADPIGQGGFNPFSKPDQFFGDAFSSTGEEINRIVETTKNDILYSTFSGAENLIPQPFSSNLMPLSSNPRSLETTQERHHQEISNMIDNGTIVHQLKIGRNNVLLLDIPVESTEQITSVHFMIRNGASHSDSSVISETEEHFPKTPRTTTTITTQENQDTTDTSLLSDRNRIKLSAFDAPQPHVTLISPLSSPSLNKRFSNTSSSDEQNWSEGLGFRPKNLRLQKEPPKANITPIGLTEEEKDPSDVPVFEVFSQRRDISSTYEQKKKRAQQSEGPQSELNQGTHVFGVDDRKAFKNASYPWSAVGRVRSAKGVCTGTLVGKRLVVTGSHCIPWTSKGGAEWITFTPAYYRSEEPFGSCGVENVLVYVKISGAMTNLQSAFDQAILVLKEPLGEKAGYVGYTTFQRDWLGKPYWYNVGYPIELQQSGVPVISSEGSIDFMDEYSIQSWKSYLLGTFIDMTSGHSGGPVWGFFGDEDFPRVVALISSESATKGNDKDGDNNLSGGPALTHLINYAREQYEDA
eukprot:MONOS_10732.1-p1 / transcript=MONOS_10732.1 / gene=MONOS_10732 / organism=Monocercomonoides_exilis_PA203 / gene_product=endopeptidase / transcript_product=endopeptidase / location=Mono_scaffold00499:11864-15556(-) / protein_length=527 / sequence_SO=supercontig / SO=protein_coding / is_pseudo=false